MSGSSHKPVVLSVEKKRDLLAHLLENRIRYTNTFPLSFAQERLWFLAQLEGKEGSATYNIQQFWSIKGQLNIEALEKSINEIIRRHTIFRTTFTSREGEPAQVIDKVPHVHLPIKDLQQLPGDEQSHRVKALAIEEARRPFDLEKGPLFRLCLLRLGQMEHILLLVMHHIVTDAWSNRIFYHELVALYNAFSKNLPSPLPNLPIQYVDFAVWQRKQFKKGVFEAQLSYWKKQLSGAPPVSELPGDRPRPPFQTFHGAKNYFYLSSSFTQKLKRVNQQNGTTLYMSLLAAFALLLSRCSGEEDIVIGTPTANRRRKQIEPLIGFFVNTLVMRIVLSGDYTFKEFLGYVRKVTLDAYANQDLPFEKLVEELQPERNLSYSPLFQVMLTVQNIPSREKEQVDLTISPLKIGDNTVKFDLELMVVEIKDGIEFQFEYCVDLFKEETIERFSKYFKRIISSFLDNSNQKLSEIEIITEQEKKQVLFDFNNTKRPIVRDKDYPQIFEEQVVKHPDKIAAVSNDGQITYKELNEEANGIAHFLLEQGVTVDTIVALYLKRSITMLASIIGVLKANGAFLPLEVDYPQNRIEYILENGEVNIAITETGNIQILHSIYPALSRLRDILCLDHEKRFEPVAQNQSVKKSVKNSLPDNLAYLIYTSGTTGKPKGVMIHQLGMLNHLYAKINDLSITSDDKIAQTASACFDISVWQFLAGLLKGGMTVIIDKEIVLEPQRFLHTLQKTGVTILESVPSLMTIFLESAAHEQDKALNLRWMIPTGEPLGAQLVREWYRHFPGIPLVNAYGPTEVSDDVTHYFFDAVPTGDQLSIPVGKPLQNLHIYILDKNLSLSPVGAKGEICVAGIGVGKGYWKDSEKTKEVFIPNPYLDEIGDRDFAKMYKTGDAGYFTPDGNVVFLGRLDDQVKIRGNRVELGEIECQIMNHPGIKETVVITKEDEMGNSVLCAYITSDKECDISELREYLSKVLPFYMIPSYFVKLERIPLTPNGKVDRKALPQPHLMENEEYTTPQNELQKKVTEIWAQVLNIRKDMIGIDNNFFHLGGHSLKAAYLISRIHKAFDVKIPLAEVFKIPTIRGISTVINQLAKDRFVSIEPVEEKEYYGLSPAQTRMYIVQHMYSHSLGYNMPSTLLLEGDVDKGKLADAFRGLVKRHDSLRTCFITVAEKPMQKIRDEVEFELDYHDVSEFGPDGNPGESEKNHYLSSIIQNFIRPFDLSKAPIMRAGLIKLKAKEHILVVDTHHIVTDGVSAEILNRDLILLYSGQELPPLSLRYKDFSEWQNTADQKKLLKKQEEYWIQKFKGKIPVVNLPTDYDRNETINFEGNYVQFLIPPRISQKMEDLNRQMGVTLFMFLLAVYNILLYRYTGQEDIVVGSPVTGRNHLDLHHIIGMFVNMLVLRNQLRGRKTFKEFLKDVQQNVLDAFANQDYQFDSLVKSLGVQRKSPKNPLFNTVLALQNIDTSGSEKAFTAHCNRLTLKHYQSNTIISRFDLTIFVSEDNGKTRFLCQYSTSLFKEKTIKKLGEHYIEIIDQVTNKPEIKLEDIVLSSSLMHGSHIIKEDDADFDF